MALLFADGFGHAGSTVGEFMYLKYDAYYTTSSSYMKYAAGIGADGGWGFMFVSDSRNYLTKFITHSGDTIITGLRFKLRGFDSANALLRLRDVSSEQLLLYIDPDGSIRLRSTVDIAQSDGGVFSRDKWTYLEVKVKFSATVGTVEVRVDGVVVINETGLDTIDSANESITTIVMYGGIYDTYIDDLYICDTTGTTCNDFLGDVHISTLYPTSDGTHTDFTPSTGTDHFATVDEPQLIADTDYNSSSTIGDKDTYGMGAYTASGTIHAVQVCAGARTRDVGARTVKVLCRSGTTPADNESADIPLSVTHRSGRYILEEEPTDSVAWTDSKINAAEFGLKVES